MPSFVRPTKGGGSGASMRPTPGTPMSERQQLALLMQMTGGEGSRSPQSSTRPRDRNERGETPLHLAAIKGDVEQVNKLLAHRADPNVGDFAGWTPLHEACNHGWYEVASRLVQAGANVNAKGLDNETPLHDAAINGNMKLIKLLVDRGADVYAKNSKGKTPLDVAVTPSIADFLLNPNQPFAETSASTRLQPRARDDKKITTEKKEEMESKTAPADDVYEFKATKETMEKSPTEKQETEQEAETAPSETQIVPPEPEANKRNFAEIADNDNIEAAAGNDEESRHKKRKDSDAKDVKSSNIGARGSTNAAKALNAKSNASGNKTTSGTISKDRKSPVDSPKAASDAEMDDAKSDLKVPPLKIVIPQSTQEQETGQSRNGKNNSQRSHAALPYVVPSSTEGGEKESNSGNNSPTDSLTSKDDKKESAGSINDEKAHHQRVLRSSHRGGQTDRSNNSSPQLQRSHSPSPSASPAAPTTEIPAVTTQGTTSGTNKSSESQASNNSDTEPSTSSSNSNSGNNNSVPVELHPRKRKMKPSKEATAPTTSDTLDTPAVSEVHPHDQPITNCYQLYLNIRKQIDKRRKGLFPVQPKPPQGFKDYLMNRGTYVLAGRAPTTPNITYPATLTSQMKDLFSDQEKERYKLRMQHVIEKEKLVLSVEQEILRVHGRAARALANQSLPFSVCTILRDEEVYNLITPEQEEKDRNARSRYNGRLFLSWLQDVDDKWEKIKEHMLLRHHNEAESLYAVQKMDWEWKLKELNLCDAKSTPNIDDLHVPMVHVSDDFDLLPA